MSELRNYIYVDAHYEHPTKKTAMPWIRMAIGDVGKNIIGPSQGANCFFSAQRFRDAVSLRERAALNATVTKRKKNGHDEEEAARIKRESEADELPDQQLHYNGFYFDFDCDYEKLKIPLEDAIKRSRADAVKLASWFLTQFDLNPPHVQCWFSGKKGFHVYVHPEPFGIQPHRHLTYIIKHVALQLKASLDLPTLDTSVYTISRMWRIPNTTHPSTGRFKIELSNEELKNWDVGKILEQSRGPRTGYGADRAIIISNLYDAIEYKDIDHIEDAVTWWRQFIELYDIQADMMRLRPRRPIMKPRDSDDWPECISDMLEGGPKNGGPNRNRVLLPIAGFLHDAGIGKTEAHSMIKQWTESFYPEPQFMRERVQNGRSVVDCAYRGMLRFSCRAIRGNRGTGAAGRVKCCGESNCPWIGEPADQEPEEIPTVHLSEATKGCYIDTVVRTPVHVAALAGHPFDLPVKGKILCNPQPEAKICVNCPNLEGKGGMGWVMNAEEYLVLQMINVNENQRKGAIKKKCGIPEKCFRHRIKIDEHSNVEEIQIIPMVDFAQVYMEDSHKDEDIAVRSARHVVRRGFHLGHGLTANKKYMMEGSVFAHPKDQRVCFLSDKFEPAQNDIDQFEMSPELYQQLLTFQRRGESVEQKLIDIHRDLTANVHQIGGRFDLSIAIDLCYHSVIGFKFGGKPINKGWFELLIMGDTATGKTTMVERLMQHYGLGELIAGEDSKRTGLVYASIQMQGQWILRWGKIPQNDRRLLIIDEFAGIPGEEVAKMTQLRSEGRARGGGVNADYETFARTRLILLTNPRNNRGKLAGFNYGIQAIRDLFDENQDTRRVDLAIIAAKGEVPTELVNKRWDKVVYPHRYTSDLCRNLVLWAWSREPHNVEWTADAEDLVGKWANRLGQTYECDISLAEEADLRLKIARISAAVAARLFSTDGEAKKVIVTDDHVDFAARFMDRAYRKPSMAYFEYARRYKKDNNFTEKRTSEITATMESFDDYDKVISTLLDVDLITKPTLTDMVNFEQDELKRLWKFMVGGRLIRRSTKGYRKSPAFTEFLRAMSSKTKATQEDLFSSEFQTGGNFASEEGGDVVALFPTSLDDGGDFSTKLPTADACEVLPITDDEPFTDDEEEPFTDDDDTVGDDPPF